MRNLNTLCQNFALHSPSHKINFSNRNTKIYNTRLVRISITVIMTKI